MLVTSSHVSLAESMEILLSDHANHQTLSEVTKEKILAFFKETNNLLPSKMKQAINAPVLVSFEDIPDKKICSRVYAKHTKDGAYQVIIDQRFISYITDGGMLNNTNFGKHKNAYTLVKAMLIHEIAHIYYHTMPRGELKQFKNLFEFRKKGIIKKSRKSINQKTGRSPDAYEYKNEKEAFAVNMEFFLLDPHYACRRPAKNHFFEQHFAHSPFPKGSCTPANMLRMTGEGIFAGGQASMFRKLDTERVYGIHYLFARQNKRILGRWGHAMYRIIVCSPERKMLGPDCLQDIDHHLVLSLEGQVDDADIDYLKGLNGHYPIHANIQSFEFTRNKYRYYEDRGLLSLPINLDKVNKEIFLNKIMEMQEEYQSPYYFFSNNCATEALDLLKSTSSDLKLHKFYTNTPIGLLKGLIKLGFLDDSVLKDSDFALRKGYLWESNSEFMQKSIDNIKAIDSDFPLKKFPEYSQMPGPNRLQLFHDCAQQFPEEKARLSLYFFELEAGLTKELVLNKVYQLLSLYKRGDDEQKLNDLELEVFEALKKLNSDFAELAALPDHQRDTYGLPLKEEFDAYFADLMNKIEGMRKSKFESTQINLLFNRFFEKTNNMIDGSRKNKASLKDAFQKGAVQI